VENKPITIRFRQFGLFLAVPLMLVLAGCAGVSSGSQKQNAGAAQLVVNPSTMSFGIVALGSNSVQNGTLTAGTADITVSSAAWNGSGYSLSGITFPVTVPATQSVPFTVTFAPQAAGSAPGTIAFDSNAINSPTTEILSGNAEQPGLHSVALSWNPSSSQVIGYNIYRRLTSGSYYTRVNTSVDPNTSYTDSTVLSGQNYEYVTTAVDSSYVESAYSNPATAAIP
jgi:hypothetical protein